MAVRVGGPHNFAPEAGSQHQYDVLSVQGSSALHSSSNHAAGRGVVGTGRPERTTGHRARLLRPMIRGEGAREPPKPSFPYIDERDW
jgi:hypothetical protein